MIGCIIVEVDLLDWASSACHHWPSCRWPTALKTRQRLGVRCHGESPNLDRARTNSASKLSESLSAVDRPMFTSRQSHDSIEPWAHDHWTNSASDNFLVDRSSTARSAPGEPAQLSASLSFSAAASVSDLSMRLVVIARSRATPLDCILRAQGPFWDLAKSLFVAVASVSVSPTRLVMTARPRR
jgi:hypothetical protein